MRTTLDLDEDVVQAVKELAKQKRSTFGQVMSQLARESLQSRSQPQVRNGVPLFQPVDYSVRPDLALVNSLRDEE
jgi:hypothetical protein